MAKDTESKPVPTVEVDKNAEVRRVFQCLDMRRPNTLVTIMRAAHNDAQNNFIPSQHCELTINSANQFVLPADAIEYAEQLRALRQAVKNGKWKMIEFGPNSPKYKEGELPSMLKGKSANGLAESKRAEILALDPGLKELHSAFLVENDELKGENERLKAELDALRAK